MGKVEFLAIKEGEYFVPAIVIHFKDGEDKDGQISFIADKRTKDKEQVKSMLNFSFEVLTGKRGLSEIQRESEI